MSTDALRDDFIAYPTNRVAGTIADSAAARRAVDALTAAGRLLSTDELLSESE